MGLKERLIVAASVVGAVFLVAPAVFAKSNPTIIAGPISSSHPNVVPSHALKLGISSYTNGSGTAIVHNVPRPSTKVEIFWFPTESQTPTSTPPAKYRVGRASRTGKYTDVSFTLSSNEASSGYLRAYASGSAASNWSAPLALPINTVPYGDMPEVPYAAVLPLMALGTFGLLRLHASRRGVRQAG